MKVIKRRGTQSASGLRSKFIASRKSSGGVREAHRKRTLVDESVRVSNSGRPDLAGPALSQVRVATLLIVGGLDFPVIEMNQEVFARLRCEKDLKIVPGATHLFEEPGTLEKVSTLAADWFHSHLRSFQEE